MIRNRFRWVFCQLEVLRHCFPSNLRHVIEELPKSLDETYKHILRAINNANGVHAYRLLQCLAIASRPLRVEDLAEVLAFDLSPGGIPKLNPDWRWENQEEAVLSACSSLVSVITEYGSRVVQFSHFSVKEFLTSDRLASCMEVSQFYIPIEPSHVILAQACLGVLLCLDDHADEVSVQQTPLFEYAAEYWVGHAQVGNVELEIKDTLDYFFDMDKPHFPAWARIQYPYELLTASRDRGSRDVVPSAAPLCFAAWKGFRRLVERLLIKDPQQVDQLGGRLGTPLAASLRGGHFEVAQLLFAHGGDINSRSPDNDTPLHLASAMGHVEIGKWLLNHGAEVNSQGEGSLTPMHFATGYGHLEVVRMLLKHNADVNSRSDDGSTPLLRASQSGNPDVFRLLLDHNADIHVCDKRGNTPLHHAAEDGHLEVARMLLDRNIEVDSRDDDGSTPFLRASQSGHSGIIWLLLDHNADVHVHDDEGNTPLQGAVHHGLVEVARMLLERNVEVNFCDSHGSTPLLLASKSGNNDLVQLLLDYNADVHTHDNYGNSPLQVAARIGLLEIARLLLERNVEVNFCNSYGSTPLLLASQSGYTDVVRLLMDYNADVCARNANGDTPLYCATECGHLEITRILLECRAEANSQNNRGRTPLHEASKGRMQGSLDIVRLLLDHGADMQVHDISGQTASELAHEYGAHEIVKLLSQHTAA